MLKVLKPVVVVVSTFVKIFELYFVTQSLEVSPQISEWVYIEISQQ
jgi:hypothetical protein